MSFVRYTAEKRAQARRMDELGEELFGDSYLAWMAKPNTLFGGKSPAQEFRGGDSGKVVELMEAMRVEGGSG